MDEQPSEKRPQHRVVTDIIITDNNKVVLIRRKHAPFKGMWCLPGGHVEHGEQVEHAAKREATEETGLDITLNDLLGVYDAPGRDPRGPVISLVYTATAEDTSLDPETDAADAKWVPLTDLPEELGFDHTTILNNYLNQQN